MKQGILFDLDGTLWDSSEGVVTSWNLALEKCEDISYRLTLDDMYNAMGKTMEMIAKMLFGGVTKQRQMEILKLCCEEEERYLREYGGILYPDLKETLVKLKKEYELFIVSNCQSGYIETFLDVHEMKGYFQDIECWGNTGRPKGENIKLVLERNGLVRAVYVGDTQGDADASEFATIPFIYAKYGFGSVENPKYRIDGLKDLPVQMEDVHFD